MKILYGVPSEGMGHATRSKVVISHLINCGHDVRIATSDRAFDLLEKAFPGRCVRIEGLHLKYEQGSLDKSASISNLLKVAPESLKTNIAQYAHLFKDELPEAVISDFESFTYLFAKLKRLPLLSIDNMQVINRCTLDFEIPKAEKESYKLAKSAIKAKVPYCHRYLVSSFFLAEVRKPNTRIIPPILRDAVIDAQKVNYPERSHILVYQTASSQDSLIGELQNVKDEHFIVYGLNRDETKDNVTLRKFSETGFIEDLACAQAVITNGGFSLISEAVYLHRPVCSFPLIGQFEQYVNGTEIEQLGYGRRFSHFSSDAVKSFLYDLKRFKANIKEYRQTGNTQTFAQVDNFLADVQVGAFPPEE